MKAPFVFWIAYAIALSPVAANEGPVWKSEKEFRKAIPMVHRLALWLEENPEADGWSDSLQTVLSWGREVPYVKLATAKVFEKEMQNLPRDPAAGRLSSMLRVGYVQFVTEPGSGNPTEFELAKAGVTCMIRYYENLQRMRPGYAIPAMERLADFFHSGALDEFIQAKLRK